MTSTNVLLANEIQDMYDLKCFFATCVYLWENFRVRLATQPQVSTQVQLASTCDYLRLRLARALEEPHQLTKFIGPLKPYLAENISLQSSTYNILGLTATVAFFANEARFTQI